MGNFLSENKNEEVENTSSGKTEKEVASDETKESLKTDIKDSADITSNNNSPSDNNTTVAPRYLIQTPIICPKGQRPDRYGICRPIF